MTIDDIRAQLPATQATAYLNTGTSGPLPVPAVAAMTAALQRELRDGRATPSGSADFPPLLRETRRRLAALLGADDDEIALTHSATDGINIAVWGLRWAPGDEVLTTTVEHPGVRVPLHQLQRRAGVTVRAVEPRQVAYAIGEHTRLVALSHVSFSTGERLPLEQIVQASHAAGAMVLVDGAQSVGAIPVDVHALGADFYALPGQKWLCGPDGSGALYVRSDHFAILEPTFVGIRNLAPSGGQGRDPNNLTLAQTGSRYETGQPARVAVYGLHAALGWLCDEVGLETVFSRTRELTGYCFARVSELDGVEMVTPADALAGLVNFRLAGVSVAALGAQGVTIRAIPETNSLRVSCAFFNTQAEIGRLVAALAQARSADS